MKKKRIYILLLTIEIMLNSIIPFHISVATEKIPSTNLQEKNSETQLLQDEISKLIKNIFVIDSYAEKIQNLERTTLEHIILIDEELGKKISRHQEQARKHTEDWLYNIKKEIICLSENLMNAKFEKSLDELSYGIKIKNTEIIQQEMKDLLGIINDSKNQVNKLIETLKTFRYKVSHDYQFFKEDNHSLERLLKIDNTNITMLKTQINDFNDSIHKLEKSQFACLLGALVCFPILGITESKISDIQKEKQYVKDKLSQKEKEVAILN
ncbi:TPA: HBL/NHE enterotoxin family protein, partial [Bacillus cytotoxicus]|nr:HBL/NHE enterotoxin family protein [Bacillus cytotoxicus]